MIKFHMFILIFSRNLFTGRQIEHCACYNGLSQSYGIFEQWDCGFAEKMQSATEESGESGDSAGLEGAVPQVQRRRHSVGFAVSGVWELHVDSLQQHGISPQSHQKESDCDFGNVQDEVDNCHWREEGNAEKSERREEYEDEGKSAGDGEVGDGEEEVNFKALHEI